MIGWWAVAFLVVVALALRLPGIASRSLWLDEAWRANIAVAPSWSAFWSSVLQSDEIGAPMPPLFAFALRLGALCGGRSAGALRAVPLVASVAAVPLAFFLVRRLAGVPAAIAAAALFACWPAAVLHGRELKQYSVDVALLLALLILVHAVRHRPTDARRWMVYAVAAALVPGLSYPVTLVLPALALLSVPGERSARGWWLGAHVLAGAAAIAWYVEFIAIQRQRPLTAAYWAAQFPALDAGAMPGWIAGQLVAFAAYATADPVWVYLAVAALGYAVLPAWFRWTALVTLLTVVVAAAVRVYPLAGGRTSLFLVPFLYVPLGAAVAWAWPPAGTRVRAPVLARVAGFIALALVLAWPARADRDRDLGLVFEEVAPLVAQLRAERQPNDRVYVYCGAVPAFRFYHPERDERIVLGASHRGDDAAYEKEIQAGLARGDRLWVLFSHVYQPPKGRAERDVILSALGVYAREADHTELPGASLHRFDVVQTPGAVRHLRLTPEDMRDPERMKELLGR